MKPIKSWLSDSELTTIYSSKYWNDIETEKTKEWWMAEGNYERCKKYLKESGLLEEYYTAESYITGDTKQSLRILDLAAGIGWTSALLSKLQNVSEVHAVEISNHRLSELFEHAFKMLDGEEVKVSRYLGSFYDIHLEDQSMDVIFLSQAFHHADKPFKLLSECDRVLRGGGKMLLVGEHNIGPKKIMRRFFACLVKQRKIFTNFYNLFPPDDILGDHYYRRSDYYFLLGGYGYQVRHEIMSSGNAIYVAYKTG